ncbi:hypothetical protein PO878_14045 [Iamia majanohamensis]|uniref:Uncharacterized protein n=1 Tax=Iamia majanohamensis TaxID=467976 RepID=A0AAE9Y3W5_9ACTN|nr:hypothetical protein [Iamia majanohamensis]WCO65622.1 hypothetical protein PO878_14045 [Iamia majanohamensis]
MDHSPDDLMDIPLSPAERRLLRGGIGGWGGPARCTEEMAVALGFRTERDLLDEGHRLIEALDAAAPMTRLDWTRLLLATEVCFASNVVGSGLDWRSTVGLTDEESILLLRAVQRRISGQVATIGTRPPHGR